VTTVFGLLLVAALLGIIALSAVHVTPGGVIFVVRIGAGAALAAAAVWALVARQVGIALGLAGISLALLGPLIAARRAAPSPGRASEVRTDALAMTLDHDTGAMNGEVLAGRFAGRRLSELTPEELQALIDDMEGDEDSRSLIWAYLDRRGGEAEGAAPPPDPGAMSEADAYNVLGLEPGAGPEEIRAAHRRLMKRVHPDLGGSPALAAMLNTAKKRLDPGAP
jgi:DnaJ domain